MLLAGWEESLGSNALETTYTISAMFSDLYILLYQLLCRMLLHPTEGDIVCNIGAVLLHAVGQPYKRTALQQKYVIAILNTEHPTRLP